MILNDRVIGNPSDSSTPAQKSKKKWYESALFGKDVDSGGIFEPQENDLAMGIWISRSEKTFAPILKTPFVSERVLNIRKEFMIRRQINIRISIFEKEFLLSLIRRKRCKKIDEVNKIRIPNHKEKGEEATKDIRKINQIEKKFPRKNDTENFNIPSLNL